LVADASRSSEPPVLQAVPPLMSKARSRTPDAFRAFTVASLALPRPSERNMMYFGPAGADDSAASATDTASS
jgi:hypothetical protein